MGNPMAKIYANVIRKNRITGKTIHDVPDELKEEVRALLGPEEPAISAEDVNEQVLVSEIRERVKNGEELRTIISSLDLSDEEKWELEKQVKKEG